MGSLSSRYQKESPASKRLKGFKAEMVEQIFVGRGDVWREVEAVRTRWRIDAPAQLPPQTEYVLLPPGIGEPPDPTEEYKAYLNLKRRWFSDLKSVLLAGVPEKYLAEEEAPYVGYPPIPRSWLPWYRFASACVLYDPPKAPNMPEFAEYGGLPPLPGQEDGEETVAGVLTGRQLLQQEMVHAVERATDEAISKKMWELRAELGGLSYREAQVEVMRRHGAEIEDERERVREGYEIDMEHAPPRYWVEVDASATVDEMRETVKAVAGRVEREVRPGRDPRDRLKALTIKTLKDDLGWTQGQIADRHGWPDETLVSKWTKTGREISNGG